MSRKHQVRRWTYVAAITTALAFTVQSSSQADEWYPGLPDNVNINYFEAGWGSAGTWGGSASGGISYAKRAKQWFRSPMGMVTWVPGLRSYPRVGNTARFGVKGVAFMVSPNGAPENYGYLTPMVVRSVGFGLMPVEATVQVSQRRANGYPIPIEVELGGTYYYDDAAPGGVEKTVTPPIVTEDAFNVQILKVKVDGVDLELTGNCRTTTPAPFRIASKEVVIVHPERPPTNPALDPNYKHEWYRTHDPSEYFHPDFGGQMSGTITIPSFTGCTTTSGDDLSALMTLSVSGPDNPLTATAGFNCVSPSGDSRPLAPGWSSPKLAGDDWNCYGAKALPYPGRPAD